MNEERWYRDARIAEPHSDHEQTGCQVRAIRVATPQRTTGES
jgi:hypothetical protein